MYTVLNVYCQSRSHYYYLNLIMAKLSAVFVVVGGFVCVAYCRFISRLYN
jgi:hypothetical protein